LVVDFKASGFGSGESVAVSLDANSPGVTLGCLNNGGNEPSGLQTFTGQADADITVPSSRTGTVSGSISALPAAAESFTCPSRNMQVVCVSATYCEIDITASDTQGNNASLTVTRGTESDGCVRFTRP
jgi:hypothetical protein